MLRRRSISIVWYFVCVVVCALVLRCLTPLRLCAWGSQMVPFAGYSLPVQYPSGVLKEHMHTREKGCASLFDVSHMGQVQCVAKWLYKDNCMGRTPI